MIRKNSPTKRILAFVALAAAVVIVIVVVSGNTGSDETPAKPNQNKSGKKHKSSKKTKPVPKTYEIKDGDTLTGIAGKTGVSLARLEKLNPGLDAQALIAGQKLKLR